MATSSHVPMPYLDWNKDNKQEAYDEWKEFMESFFIINNVPNDNKYHYILLSTGTKGRDIVQSSKISTTDKLNPTKVWKVFENFLVEKPNKWVERIELQSQSQTTEEGIEAFILRLRNKTAKCSFGDENTCNDRILEQLIKGCKYQNERKRLLEQDDALNLDKAINLLKSHEASIRHVTEYSTAASRSDSKTEAELDAIKARSRSQLQQCDKCGLRHEKGKCPAFGTECNICRKPNHWANACRSMSNPSKPRQNYRHDKRDHKQWDRNKQYTSKPEVHNLMASTSRFDELNIDTVASAVDIKDQRD